MEPAREPAIGVEYYIPHKAVIRESSESTKLRVVYDASARASPTPPSLNECLYPAPPPPLQAKLWDILVHQRMYPVAVTADIEKAFLQVRIRECERDALRFHWQCGEQSELETLRFTRALFGLAPSPFLLGGVIECHLALWEDKYPELVAEIRRSLYVDDLLTGGQTVQQAKERKERAVEIFNDATFNLHKWNSNAEELEPKVNSTVEDDQQSYAKQQLGVKPNESKMLGLKWDKVQDTLTVNFPRSVDRNDTVTKRGILRNLAKIYDPLGLVSPVTLEGKLIYRDVCCAKLPWDMELDDSLRQRWKKWERSVPCAETVPRSIVDYREDVLSVELHAFGDASTQGVGAAVYSVIRQPSGVTQRLVAVKARLAKQGLTIPRLELVSAHSATNLVTNVAHALQGLPEPRIHGWLDSTVALHWICGNGQYNQFVENRVSKIREHSEIQWRHVPTLDNPADLASRGGPVNGSSIWWNGPEWLQNPDQWPDNPVTKSSPASEAKSKRVKEVLRVAQEDTTLDDFDAMLEKHPLRRCLRIRAWIGRFLHNCRNPMKQSGLLTAEEVDNAKMWWIKREQSRDQTRSDYEQTKTQLNLQVNTQELVECRGRIQGNYPIYLPSNALFTRRLVQRLHCETLHGGVGLTMAAVRETYWVPRLRSITKSIVRECWGCKRFHATAVQTPPPGLLPRDRTEGDTAFEVIGVDFVEPIRYKKTNRGEGKAYLALFACSLSRAVQMELLPNLETETFIPCLKRLIARRGRPRVIYSDNGGTFVKTARWLEEVRKDERLQGFLEDQEIQWKFNLSRAPWWGGQFERLIGIVKNAMYKTIGAATLSWAELSEVILDVEIQINRRPLSYVEDDVEMPTLTPSAFLFQRSSTLPEQQPWQEENQELRKRAKHLKSCKDALWRRWLKEYMNALRERHNLSHGKKRFEVHVGDVVLVKSDEKNRGKWPLANVRAIYPGRDEVVRAVQLQTGKGFLERPIQHLYPLELACDKIPEKNKPMNPDARAFTPKRKTAEAAATKIKLILDQEEEEL